MIGATILFVGKCGKNTDKGMLEMASDLEISHTPNNFLPNFPNCPTSAFTTNILALRKIQIIDAYYLLVGE